MVLERIANPSTCESRFLSSSLSRSARVAPVDKLAKSSLSKGEVVLGSSPSRGTKEYWADSLMVKRSTHNRLSESSILSQPTKMVN
jgi:hypothetical protein